MNRYLPTYAICNAKTISKYTTRILPLQNNWPLVIYLKAIIMLRKADDYIDTPMDLTNYQM